MENTKFAVFMPIYTAAAPTSNYIWLWFQTLSNCVVNPAFAGTADFWHKYPQAATALA